MLIRKYKESIKKSFPCISTTYVKIKTSPLKHHSLENLTGDVTVIISQVI